MEEEYSATKTSKLVIICNIKDIFKCMLLNERSWTQKYILCDFNYATLEKAKLP
jgi:hypothetical protein